MFSTVRGECQEPRKGTVRLYVVRPGRPKARTVEDSRVLLKTAGYEWATAGHGEGLSGTGPTSDVS